MVALSGLGSISFRTTSEVLDVFNADNNETCENLPDFPVSMTGGVGSLITDNSVFVCGGQILFSTTNQCWILGKNETAWNESSTMLASRKDAAAILINSTTLFVTGGRNGEQATNSTELVQPGQQSQTGPEMPTLPIFGHCFIKVNDSLAIMAGEAEASSTFSNETNFYSILESNWTTSGPELDQARAYHSCGIIKIFETYHAVVTGGRNPDDASEALTSTEILDMSNNETTWTTGLNLPRGIQQAQMVASSDGGSLVLLGGFQGLTATIKLDCSGGPEACQWLELDLMLNEGRHSFIALAVPDSMNTCESDTMNTTTTAPDQSGV